MTAAETIQQLMNEEAFVLSELKKLQILYKLKNEIRYGEQCCGRDGADSVAEHVYGMHCLVDYFLPLEDISGSYDRQKITRMVQYHDIDEVELGDTIGYLKTSTQRSLEPAAIQTVISQLPESVQSTIADLLEEYETRQTWESKFVKAVDKIEVLLQVYTPTGKLLLERHACTRSQHDSIKDPFLADFPIMRRFKQVVSDQMEAEGFFH